MTLDIVWVNVDIGEKAQWPLERRKGRVDDAGNAPAGARSRYRRRAFFHSRVA